MESSGSSTVSNSWPRVRSIEDESNEYVRATSDLVRAHVRLILFGSLTMEESKLVLLSAFSALGGSVSTIELAGLCPWVATSSRFWHDGRGCVDEACSGGCSSDHP